MAKEGGVRTEKTYYLFSLYKSLILCIIELSIESKVCAAKTKGHSSIQMKESDRFAENYDYFVTPHLFPLPGTLREKC